MGVAPHDCARPWRGRVRPEQPCGFLASAIGRPFPDKGQAALDSRVQRPALRRRQASFGWTLRVFGHRTDGRGAVTAATSAITSRISSSHVPRRELVLRPRARRVRRRRRRRHPRSCTRTSYIPWAKDVRTGYPEDQVRNPVVLSTGDGRRVRASGRRRVVRRSLYSESHSCTRRAAR